MKEQAEAMLKFWRQETERSGSKIHTPPWYCPGDGRHSYVGADCPPCALALALREPQPWTEQQERLLRAAQDVVNSACYALTGNETDYSIPAEDIKALKAVVAEIHNDVVKIIKAAQAARGHKTLVGLIGAGPDECQDAECGVCHVCQKQHKTSQHQA